MKRLKTWLALLVDQRVMGHAGLIAAMCLVQACAAESASTGIRPAATAATAESEAMDEHTISLTAAESVSVAQTGMRISLVEVKDSRCPIGVTCIWAGHAAVTLRVEHADGGTETVIIGTAVPAGTNLPESADAGAYRLDLLALTPHPKAGESVELKDYRAEVRIRRR